MDVEGVFQNHASLKVDLVSAAMDGLVRRPKLRGAGLQAQLFMQL